MRLFELMLLLGKAGSCHTRVEGHISIKVRVLKFLHTLKMSSTFILEVWVDAPRKCVQQVALDRHELFACNTLIC